MRVFVAGATGAVGRPLVARLLAARHEVVGMTRTPARANALHAAGAKPVVADALDRDAVHAAVTEARPDAVVHQLTALPARLEPGDPAALEPTNRLRTEGTRHLVEAAAKAGGARVVAQSLALLYAREGGWVKDEDAPLDDAAPPAAAVRELEAAVLGTGGVVLRYGMLYGPGTWYARDGTTAEQVRRRRFPIVGRGTGTFSFLHADDAASATVAALERGEGVYNVCDDEPAMLREWLPVYARALGAPRPWRVPGWLARMVAGRGAVASALELRGASNARARRELGWAPRLASWREGFRTDLG